jgi:hypothetical protein
MKYLIRVASLKYEVEQQGTVRFAESMDIRRDVVLTGFTGTVEPNAAVFIPTREFSSVDQARAQLEPQLASWRAWIRLMELEDLLVFTFVGATRESTPPAPDGHHLLAPEAGYIGLSGQSPILYHTRNSIPDPPVGFWCDDLVEVGIALYDDAGSTPRMP